MLLLLLVWFEAKANLEHRTGVFWGRGFRRGSNVPAVTFDPCGDGSGLLQPSRLSFPHFGA